MIRDPSDGSVQDKSGWCCGTPEKPYCDCKPVIDPTTSGLQTGSSKPENLARLEKARDWMRDYRAGKFKNGTENG